MKLKDLCEVKMNMSDADFWIIRRGDKKSVGKPTKEFSKEHIGIKVTSTDILDANYLFYTMCFVQSVGYYMNTAKGSTPLVNISVDDVKNLNLQSR